MKILFKYATRGRPVWFKETLRLYYDKMSGKHDFEFIITMDVDDSLMNTPEIKQYLNQIKNLKYFYISSTSKIDAINANMENTKFDILIVVSDDMQPVMENYDDIIVNDMIKYFPDCDGALHYHDGCCGKDVIITLSIMGKKMYDYFGYIYHPSYKSFYCDNEFTDVVRKLKKYKYFNCTPIKHVWRKYGHDDVYKQNSVLGAPDANTYNNRKIKNFKG
jgi:hypothetical protein